MVTNGDRGAQSMVPRLGYMLVYVAADEGVPVVGAGGGNAGGLGEETAVETKTSIFSIAAPL